MFVSLRLAPSGGRAIGAVSTATRLAVLASQTALLATLHILFIGLPCLQGALWTLQLLDASSSLWRAHCCRSCLSMSVWWLRRRHHALSRSRAVICATICSLYALKSKIEHVIGFFATFSVLPRIGFWRTSMYWAQEWNGALAKTFTLQYGVVPKSVFDAWECWECAIMYKGIHSG